MLKFTELLEDYYSLSQFQGEKEANEWLDKVLRTEDGIDAVKEMVLGAVAQAIDMTQSGASIEEYETALYQNNNTGKKKEEMN